MRFIIATLNEHYNLIYIIGIQHAGSFHPMFLFGTHVVTKQTKERDEENDAYRE